jgi:hypothetical protein
VQHLAVCRHDIGGEQVVDGQAIFPGKPSEPAAKCQASDSGCRVDSSWHRETESLGLPVNIGECRAGFHDCSSQCPIDAHRAHLRRIDNNTAVTDCVSGYIVASAANGEQQLLFAREANSMENVTGVLAAYNYARSARVSGRMDFALAME